jgi:aspartokinase
MRHVLAPKALGAINLYRAIQAEGISVDYFVLYSSITAINGTVPQTSYAAANTVLDAFADYLHARGQAVTVINWGALVAAVWRKLRRSRTLPGHDGITSD